jgi:hypothetical protein
MKTALLMAFTVLSLQSVAHAKSLIGRVDKYIILNSNQIIEIASNEIEDGKGKYYDYAEHKWKTIDMNDVSKGTTEEISGVKAGERILATTMVANSKTETVSRYCQVFYVFENKKAYVGCKSTEADIIPGYQTPNRFDFIVENVESVTAEVSSLNDFSTKEIAELNTDTKNFSSGTKVKILAIFANGEALIQKSGFNILDTSDVLNKLGAVDRINLSELNKI